MLSNSSRSVSRSTEVAANAGDRLMLAAQRALASCVLHCAGNAPRRDSDMTAARPEEATMVRPASCGACSVCTSAAASVGSSSIAAMLIVAMIPIAQDRTISIRLSHTFEVRDICKENLIFVYCELSLIKEIRIVSA
eukprot:6194970-Pleurochrysis_carterae.AAC.2